MKPGQPIRPLVIFGVGALVAVLWPLGCAAPRGAPSRVTVAEALHARTGLDAGELEPPTTWSAPPGFALDDGLSEDEAVAAALWNSAEFHAALVDLGLARADLVEAGLLRNPVLSLLFPLGPKQLEASVYWPIEGLWQRPRRVRAARLSGAAVAERLVASGLDLVASVRLAHAQAMAADRRIALATEQARLGQELSEIAAGRLHAGDVSDMEARAVRNEALRLEAERLERVHDRDLALAQLRALLELPVDSAGLRVVAGGPPPAPSSCDLAALVRTALSARPEVRAAELDVEAAGARVGLERARILTLTAILDANGEGSEGFEAGPGIGTEIPLFSRNQGGRARAEAELERASRRYLAVRARVVATVETAFVELARARDAERLWREQILPSLGDERRQAEGAYASGEVSLLATLDSRRRQIEAESRTLDAGVALRQAAVRLEQATGAACSGL